MKTQQRIENIKECLKKGELPQGEELELFEKIKHCFGQIKLMVGKDKDLYIRTVGSRADDRKIIQTDPVYIWIVSLAKELKVEYDYLKSKIMDIYLLCKYDPKTQQLSLL
jgi:hypothetical protein